MSMYRPPTAYVPKRSTRVRDKARAHFRRLRAVCYLCGRPIDYDAHYLAPTALAVDHIVSLALGGSDTLDNLAATHRACNRAKSDRGTAPPIKRSRTLN